MSDQSAGFVGSIPENYDRFLGPVLFADFADDMAQRVAGFRPDRVLETCAGTGIVTRRLRDLLPARAQLTATDLNPPMLDVARGKFRPDEQVEFQPADAMALPFPDRAFDAVVCQFGIMFFPDKERSYREARRVLRLGGRYLFSVWDEHRHNRFGSLAHEVLREIYPADPPLFYAVPFSCHRLDPIRDGLANAGFIDFRAAVLRTEKSVADWTGFARGLIYGNPVVDQIGARGGDPAMIVDTLTAALRREFGPEPGRLSLQTIVVEATRA